MRKIILPLLAFVGTSAFAQTFSDNFDSYTAGLKLGPQSAGNWTTWTNSPGGADDVNVSNANSVSGNNSLYFASNVQGGGPADVVRNFGVLNTGQFNMSMNMLVETGKTGYFNLQRNAVIGQIWAADFNFGDNGILNIVNQSGLNVSAPYPQNAWFAVELNINFNTNNWEVSIDGNVVTTFANQVNQIASIDIFPVDQTAPYSSGYFIDDFEYTITPYVLPALNISAQNVRFDAGNLAGFTANPIMKIRNLGTTTITSADLSVTYNGNTINHSATGLNLASLAETEITFTSSIVFAGGTLPLSATASNPNGGTDLDAADNTYNGTVTNITPATGKKVVGEEGTGTWCPWCTRGTVFMDRMASKYAAHWIGIAVHNGDPMTDSIYDAEIGGLIGGYPSAVVDRKPEVDPSEMEVDFLSQVQIAPKALITNGATFNPTTRELKVSVSANFQSAATNAYKMAIVLVEDSLYGTGAQWSQANAYAGGSNGPMGGFESLPNPVSYTQMVYDHVARTIAPSFDGSNGMFPATIASGQTHTMNYSFILPANWKENKMEIVGLLIDPTGKIDNAGNTTIAEAIANGFVVGVDLLSSKELPAIDATLSVYPNPVVDNVNIGINLQKESNVTLSITDASGKLIATRNYGKLNASSVITVNTNDFANGIYTVTLLVDEQLVTKTFVK